MTLTVKAPETLYTDLLSQRVPLHLKRSPSKIDVSYITDQTSIVDLALEYGVDLIEQQGGDYVALCPFHDDKDTPSFRIYSTTGTWHCFGCQRGSSVFDFVMYQDNVEFHDALHKLASRIGGSGETYSLGEIKKDAEPARFSSKKLKISLAISQKYYDIYQRHYRQRKDPEGFSQLCEFWAWYDNINQLFVQKFWDGVDPAVLEQKLYEFYGKALTRLDRLESANVDESSTRPSDGN